VTVAAGGDIDFIFMARLGDELVATATESHRGRRSGIYDVEIRNQDDVLIAVFRGRSMALGRPILPE
jgi:acyl-CoA thioesterase